MTTQNKTAFSYQLGAYLNGRYSLARVFWLYGLVGGFVAGLLVGIAPLAIQPILALCLLGYVLAWMVAAWRSASRYTGLALWRWVTYFVVLLPVIGTAITLALTFTPQEKRAAPVEAKPASSQSPTNRPMTIDEFLADAPSAQ